MLQAWLLGALLTSAVTAAQDEQTFVGTVTDSTCANADHSRMRMGPTDGERATACVFAHGDAYVLYDGTEVYALSDQPASAEFAGTRVRVTGTRDTAGRTIQVSSIAPAE